MSLDPFDHQPGQPERGKRNLPNKPQPTIEDQLAELRKKAEEVIPNQLVRPIPMPEMEMAEIVSHLEVQGFAVCPTQQEDCWVGGTRFLLQGIKEVRVGFFDGIPSIIFCYHFADQKQLKTVVAAVPDPIDPLELAKVFVRGRVAAIQPPSQVKFLSVGEFFRMDDFDPLKLHDHHCLTLRQRVYEAGIKSRFESNAHQITALNNELQTLRPLPEKVATLEEIIVGLRGDTRLYRQKLMLVVGYGIIITLMLWIPHFLHR
jgi:hypothetical protein